MEISDPAVGEGKALFNIIVKPRMSGLGIVPKEIRSRLFNLVYLIIFLTKLLEMGCLGQAWRRRRSYLAYSTHLIWRYQTCTWKRGYGRHWYVRKKPFTVEWIYGIMWKHTLLTVFFIFNIFCFITIIYIIILLFLLVYISLLPLLLLLELILSPFLPLFFSIIIY